MLLFLLLPFSGAAQQDSKRMSFLYKDSLIAHSFISLEKNWLFAEIDDPAMALPSFDDSRMDTTFAGLYLDPENKYKHKYNTFNSICWLRLHIWADTTVVGLPLALTIDQFGASELYLDGVKIKSFGTIKGPLNSKYYDPNGHPFVIVLHTSGNHLLAIRYANFNAQKNLKVYNENQAGMYIKIGLANKGIEEITNDKLNNVFLLGLISGLFFALCFCHFFLFLYNTKIHSNLFFSIFCLNLAAICLIQCLKLLPGGDPTFELSSHFTIILSIALLCFSFSGLINDLFSSGKKRLIVVTVLCIALPFVYFKDSYYGSIFGYMLCCSVLLEGIILTSAAIYRKKKGAIIVGIGMLFFSLFFFGAILYLSIYSYILLSSNISGALFSIGLIIAIFSIPISMSLNLARNFASINKDLEQNLRHVRALSETTLRQEQEKQKMIEGQKEQLEIEVAARTSEVVAQKEEIEKQHEELKIEKEKSDSLLLNILPEEIAEELKEKGHSDARLYNNVSVLFTDFVDFTKAGERMEPQQLVDELHICFKTFDEIIAKHKIEKIKTIGDAYLAVGGLPVADEDHAINAVLAALEIQQFMAERKKQLNNGTFEIRLGIHSGSVVAGIVGIKKFAYDIWGDTVNTAARMEQNSEPGKINISQSTYELTKNKFDCITRGAVIAKNKGELQMYFVEKIK